MNGKYTPQPRDITKTEMPKATDVFYSNGLSMDVNPNELVLTFDQLLPGSEPKAISIVMNANAIYQLSEAFKNMIEVHEEKLKEINRNDRKDN